MFAHMTTRLPTSLIHTHTQSVFTSINALKQNWIPNIVCAWVGLIHVSVQRNYGIMLLVWGVWALYIFFFLYTYFIYQPLVLIFYNYILKIVIFASNKQCLFPHLPRALAWGFPDSVNLMEVKSASSEDWRQRLAGTSLFCPYIVHTCNISVVKEHMMIRVSCQRLSDDQATMQSTNTPTHVGVFVCLTTTSTLITVDYLNRVYEKS